jgi:hypothetical protein
VAFASVNIQCADWTDDHLPLSYRFAVLEGSKEVSLTSFQHLPLATLALAPGSAVIRVAVRDSLHAVEFYDLNVLVPAPPALLANLAAGREEQDDGALAYVQDALTVPMARAMAASDPVQVCQLVVAAADTLAGSRSAGKLDEWSASSGVPVRRFEPTAAAEERAEVRMHLAETLASVARREPAPTHDWVQQQLEATQELTAARDELNTGARRASALLLQEQTNQAMTVLAPSLQQTAGAGAGFEAFAALLLTSVSNVQGSLLAETTSATTRAEADQLSMTFEKIISDVSSELLRVRLPGEAPVVLETPNFVLQTQNDFADNFPNLKVALPSLEWLPYPGFILPASILSHLYVGEKAVPFIPQTIDYALVVTNQDLLELIGEPADGSVSPLVTLTLFSREPAAFDAAEQTRSSNTSSVVLQVTDLPTDSPVIVFLPTDEDDISPESAGCRFWEEDTSTWSTAGCQLVSRDGSFHGRPGDFLPACSCTHLTTFNLFSVTLDVQLLERQDWANLSFERILQSPFTFVVVNIVFGCYLLMLPFVRRRDARQQYLLKKSQTEASAFPPNGNGRVLDAPLGPLPITSGMFPVSTEGPLPPPPQPPPPPAPASERDSHNLFFTSG